MGKYRSCYALGVARAKFKSVIVGKVFQTIPLAVTTNKVIRYATSSFDGYGQIFDRYDLEIYKSIYITRGTSIQMLIARKKKIMREIVGKVNYRALGLVAIKIRF